jgi:CRISPR-associated protein Csb2
VATTLAIRFPLGRYHANPWGRAVNEGASEWPPSPWRLLRALIATWHTRWPDLPAPVLDGLLDALADPPSYRTPATRPGHTRHYLPDLDHRKGETGRTDLTLDPFLSVGRDEELLVRWDADMPDEQRHVLAKLAELLPYLGRAESACEARLLNEDPVPDAAWWRADAAGSHRTRLLAPTRPLNRAVLEASTIDIRKSRRTLPPGTRWVSYGTDGQLVPRPEPAESAAGTASPVNVVRFAVMGRVPLKATHGILLADEAHRQAGLALGRAKIPDDHRQRLLGTDGAATDHRHAHWIPLAAGYQRGAPVQSLLVWVPDGLKTEDVRAVLSMRKMSGRRGGGSESGGYDISGFPDIEVLFQAAGQIEQVAPELCGPARRWRSLTPYLPVRHRKRETPGEYLAADVAAELSYRPRYRDLPPPAVARVEQGPAMVDRWASEYRRHRITERRLQSRPGLGLRLEFQEPVTGPLALGQLSHFGYGIFVPDETW